MPLSGRFFCLKGYGLLAALANSYKASKACLCRFENLPYLLYPLLPWEELTSPVLGPSGHGPHSNLWCIRRQGPPRSKDTGTESALSPCVKVHDRKAGKKTLNVQCTRETDLKHIQSNETDRQANKLISSQNYPFFPQDNNLVFPRRVMTSGKIATGGYLSQVPAVFPPFAFCAYFCCWHTNQEQMDFIAPSASSRVWIQCRIQTQCNDMRFLPSHPSHPRLKSMLLSLHGILMTLLQVESADWTLPAWRLLCAWSPARIPRCSRSRASSDA